MRTFTSTEPYTKNYRHKRDVKNVHHPTHIGGLKLLGSEGNKWEEEQESRGMTEDMRRGHVWSII